MRVSSGPPALLTNFDLAENVPRALEQSPAPRQGKIHHQSAHGTIHSFRERVEVLPPKILQFTRPARSAAYLQLCIHR